MPSGAAGRRRATPRTWKTTYAEHEPYFRSHYEERYRNGPRDYDWYEPAYRYGYASA